MVSEQTGISVSYKNKHEFSDFWAMSYCFVHIVMLIIIKMHFVLLTKISGSLLNNFEKGKKQTATYHPRPPRPQSARACKWAMIFLYKG